MIFHFVKEGDKLHRGINFIKRCPKTAWSIKIVIPIWIYKNEKWQQDNFGDVFKGFRALYLRLRLRRRTKSDFPEKTPLWLFSIKRFKGSIGKQKLIWTKEQMEDYFDATVGWYNGTML